MLTDAEFAADRRLTDDDVAAIDEAEHFSWFTLDLAAAVNPDGSPMFPELAAENRAKPLWRVIRHSSSSLKRVENEVAKKEEENRQAKLAEYIENGYAFDERAKTDPRGGVGVE